MWRTKYDIDKRSEIFSDAGSPYKTEYQLRVVDNNDTLDPIGESDLYSYIQSHADSVDIHKILERCALIDDYSMLNKMPARFMDVTEMPKTLAEAYSKIQDAKEMFNRMPLDIKESYDNNFVNFIDSLGSEKFEKVVGEFLNKEKMKNNPDKVDEVKSDES